METEQKEFKIKESDLVKIKQYLGEIPHKYALEIEKFLFNKDVLIEIDEEKSKNK